jgi:hypothetical protein
MSLYTTSPVRSHHCTTLDGLGADPWWQRWSGADLGQQGAHIDRVWGNLTVGFLSALSGSIIVDSDRGVVLGVGLGMGGDHDGQSAHDNNLWGTQGDGILRAAPHRA